MPNSREAAAAFMLGMASGIGIDDEGAVKPLMDVPLQRHRVAVIEVAAEGKGIEFVDETLPRRGLARARHAVHARGVDAVEVHAMRMRPGIDEADADPVALGDPEGRTGNAAVEGPSREHDAGGDFDFLVFGDDVEVPELASVGERADAAPVPIGEDAGGIESVANRIDLAHREHAAMAGVMARGRAGGNGLDRRVGDAIVRLAARDAGYARRERKPTRPQHGAARQSHPAPPIGHCPPLRMRSSD